MDNELKLYEHIISDMKNEILKFAMSTKLDMNSSHFWESLDEWLSKFLQGYPYKEEYKVTEITQKKIKKYASELAEDIFNNPKLIKTIESLRKKRAEIEKLEHDIEELTSEVKVMVEEREGLEKYISFEGINQLLVNSGGEEVATNTLSKWNSKGLLGDALTEKDICPNSFDNHRIIYFSKEKVLDFLIKENKITPKYEILDQIEEGTVLKYVITRENTLGYYCKEFDTGIETIAR